MARYESYEEANTLIGSFLTSLNAERNPSEHMLAASGTGSSVIVCLKFN